LDRAGVSRKQCKHAEGLWAIQSIVKVVHMEFDMKNGSKQH
jgi:hypothetical protein